MNWLRSDQEVALNEVVRLLREAAERCLAAAERAQDRTLAKLLRTFHEKHEAAASRLVAHSEAEAAVPDPDAEFVHDVVAGLKAALANDTDQAIRSDVLEGEDALEQAARSALAFDLPAAVNDTLNAVLGDVAALRKALET